MHVHLVDAAASLSTAVWRWRSAISASSFASHGQPFSANVGDHGEESSVCVCVRAACLVLLSVARCFKRHPCKCVSTTTRFRCQHEGALIALSKACDLSKTLT